MIFASSGGELQAHGGGERNLDRFQQYFRAILFGDLHDGLALGEHLVIRLAAQQPQREQHVAFVIREIMYPAQNAQRVAFL